MPRPPIELAAIYENSHLVSRDLLVDIRQLLDAMITSDDTGLTRRHTHVLNQINAKLSDVVVLIDHANRFPNS